MSNYIIVRGKEYSSLSHFGVKGMKWGVRRQQRLEKKIGDAATKTAKEVTKNRRTSEFFIDGKHTTVPNKASDKHYRKAQKYQKQGERYMKKYKKLYGVQVYGRTGFDVSKAEAYIQVKYGESNNIRTYRGSV